MPTSRPVVNGIRLCRAFQSGLRVFPGEALISPAAFLQSTEIASRGVLRDKSPGRFSVNASSTLLLAVRGAATPLDILATKCYVFCR